MSVFKKKSHNRADKDIPLAPRSTHIALFMTDELSSGLSKDFAVLTQHSSFTVTSNGSIVDLSLFTVEPAWFDPVHEPRTTAINRLYCLRDRQFRQLDRRTEYPPIEPFAQKQQQPRTDHPKRRVIRGCIAYPVSGSGNL